MSTLIARLRAAIDEDERAALAWLPIGNPDAAAREHPARHDPGRALAMVAAHRAILDEHFEGADGSCLGCGANYYEEPRVPNINDCETLRALAKGYGIEEAK